MVPIARGRLRSLEADIAISIALAEVEMAVADLRAELQRTERTRDQVKRDSERAQAADAKAAAEMQRAGQRVADLLARIETL